MTATEARLTGRHAFVTGGTRGIGFDAAISMVAGLGGHHLRREPNIDPMLPDLPPVSAPGTPS